MQTNQPDILQDKKERNDFLVALTVIVLTGVFITQTSLISNDEATAQITAPATDIDTETEDRTSKYLIEDKEIERPVEETIAPRRKQTPVLPFIHHTREEASRDKINFSPAATNTQEVKNTHGDIAVEAMKEASEEANEVIAAVKEVGTEIKGKTTEATEEITEKSNKEIEKETTNEVVNSVIQEKKALLSSALDKKDFDSKDCVIAIGLYEEPKNVSKLSSRLESEGYDVFTKDLRRLTQVGVYISCDPTISKSVLSLSLIHI